MILIFYMSRTTHVVCGSTNAFVTNYFLTECAGLFFFFGLSAFSIFRRLPNRVVVIAFSFLFLGCALADEGKQEKTMILLQHKLIKLSWQSRLISVVLREQVGVA